MSDLMSAIRDDIKEYRCLCKLFDEEIKYTKDHYGILIEDCYGKHAEKLRNRKRESRNVS